MSQSALRITAADHLACLVQEHESYISAATAELSEGERGNLADIQADVEALRADQVERARKFIFGSGAGQCHYTAVAMLALAEAIRLEAGEAADLYVQEGIRILRRAAAEFAILDAKTA